VVEIKWQKIVEIKWQKVVEIKWAVDNRICLKGSACPLISAGRKKTKRMKQTETFFARLKAVYIIETPQLCTAV
jgi:hypothetical protein